MVRGRIANGGVLRVSADRLRLTLCVLLILLGISVVAGWLLRIEELKAVVPGLSTMKFNTAVGFVLAGLGIAAAGRETRLLVHVAAIAGLLLGAIGLATIVQYGSGLHLGIDEAVVADKGTLSGSGHPGRMSLLTAFAFSMLGSAVVLLAYAGRRTTIVLAHILAIGAGATALLAIAGYAFGAQAFWGIGRYTAIAVHTAAGLLVAAAATLMTRAEQGWFEPFVDSPAARSLLTRLLPFSLLLPVALGTIIMFGAGIGIYNAPYGFALFIPSIAIGLILLSLWVARNQRESELTQRRHERHLELLVAELNHRVKNTLSIVQSFAHQSLSDATSTRDADLPSKVGSPH